MKASVMATNAVPGNSISSGIAISESGFSPLMGSVW